MVQRWGWRDGPSSGAPEFGRTRLLERAVSAGKSSSSYRVVEVQEEEEEIQWKWLWKRRERRGERREKSINAVWKGWYIISYFNIIIINECEHCYLIKLVFSFPIFDKLYPYVFVTIEKGVSRNNCLVMLWNVHYLYLEQMPSIICFSFFIWIENASWTKVRVYGNCVF